MHIRYYLLMSIIVLFPKLLFATNYIEMDKGPLYIQNSQGKGIKRYLPNIILKFEYEDTTGKTYRNIFLKTNELGEVINGTLPLSEGSKINGTIEVYYTLVDHTKSVYNDKGDILVTTSIKIEAPSLEKTPQGFIEINEELIYNSNTDKWIFPPISKIPMQSHLPPDFNDKYFAMHAYYLGTKIGRIVGSSPSTIVIDNNASASSYKSSTITIASLTCTSKYDSLYKHEYGHHIYNTIFGIEQENYTKDYEIFESCDEQTAVNEGLSFFLMSQGPFEPFLSNDMPSNVQLNLDPTQNTIQKNLIDLSGGYSVMNIFRLNYFYVKEDKND